MKPKFTNRDAARRLNVLGIDHVVLLDGADTGGALTLLEAVIPPGLGIPPHVHTREDEVFHVLNGQVEFAVAGSRRLVNPGETVFGPRDVTHGFSSSEGATMLIVVQPAGLERMLAELAQLGAGPPDVARLSEIVGRQGIRFAQP
ncbi:MAG: cupin domain-containing protein [Phycisphaerae bacterium]|nr:cupin domain-containing protein [Phycisphaerae bacterium]MCZ2400462.1 cupin domain-containing protein [Phycisphaerae bacterium]